MVEFQKKLSTRALLFVNIVRHNKVHTLRLAAVVFIRIGFVRALHSEFCRCRPKTDRRAVVIQKRLALMIAVFQNH
jgi:hypothetical protein